VPSWLSVSGFHLQLGHTQGFYGYWFCLSRSLLLLEKSISTEGLVGRVRPSKPLLLVRPRYYSLVTEWIPLLNNLRRHKPFLRLFWPSLHSYFWLEELLLLVSWIFSQPSIWSDHRVLDMQCIVEKRSYGIRLMQHGVYGWVSLRWVLSSIFRDICHLLRACLLSTNISLICNGTLGFSWCVLFATGVACHAAFCMRVVQWCTASSISVCSLRLRWRFIQVLLLIRSPNLLQSVCPGTRV
jgi:hypothetical protein